MESHKISKNLERRLCKLSFEQQSNLIGDIKRFRELFVFGHSYVSVSDVWLNRAIVMYKKEVQDRYGIDYSHEFSSLYTLIKNVE